MRSWLWWRRLFIAAVIAWLLRSFCYFVDVVASLPSGLPALLSLMGAWLVMVVAPVELPLEPRASNLLRLAFGRGRGAFDTNPPLLRLAAAGLIALATAPVALVASFDHQALQTSDDISAALASAVVPAVLLLALVSALRRRP